VNVEKMTGILEIKCIFSYIYEATIRKFPIASHYETERYCFRRHRDPDNSGHGCFLIYGIFIPRLIRAIPSSFLPVCRQTYPGFFHLLFANASTKGETARSFGGLRKTMIGGIT
jgi:hypothetical protein